MKVCVVSGNQHLCTFSHNIIQLEASSNIISINSSSCQIYMAKYDHKIVNMKDLPPPASIYLFKIKNGDTKMMSKICSKLPIKTPKRRQ